AHRLVHGFLFFFQAEDGIRDDLVTGVQTCALPISLAMVLTLGFGWRMSYLWQGVGLLVLVLPIALWLIGNDPAERGLRPYGATEIGRASCRERVYSSGWGVGVERSTETARTEQGDR